jgi:LAGLIDADG-like domain
MPSNNQKFNKKSQESVLGKLVDQSIGETTNILNALDFVESPEGFNLTLSPLQRLCVRCFFGIPFDYKPEMPGYPKAEVRDKFNDNILYSFDNEQQLLNYFYQEGRCNLGDWRDIPEGGFNEAALFAGRRGGKALSVEEVVPTPAGFKRMGDLEMGDTVLSPSGKSIKVKEAFAPFWSKVYKVSFDDGTYTLAHPEHLWKTYTVLDRRNLRSPITKNQRGAGAKRGGANFIDRASITGTVRTTEEIRASLLHGKERNHTIRITAPVEFEDKQLPLDPYCLGVWLGDGCKADGYLIIHPDDAPETLSHFTAAGFKWKPGKHAKDFSWSVFGLPLRKMKLWKNKHIPKEYLYASVTQRLALLQGLMDTDGYCADDGQCEFSNTNLNLAEGVYHLAASLGLKPYWKEGRATLYGKDCGPYYAVLWTATMPVFRLKRKLAKIPKKVRDLQNYRTITNVEYAGETLVRCIAVDSPDGLFLFGKNFNVTHNSELVAAIGGYALYKLLNIRSPQEYYGLMPGSPIDFTFMAADEEGSNRLYDKLKERINHSPFFSPYIRDNGSKMTFVSEADRGKRDITPTITVSSFPCTTNALRGPSSLFLALDEFAHFRPTKDTSSDKIYEAATPATMRFLANGRGRRESMILSISSPWQRIGKMYELHKLALDKGSKSGIFTLRCSTTEMYPYADSQYLHQQYDKSQLTWRAEYGGEFLDSSETYVKGTQLDICIDKERENIIHFVPSVLGHEYFWGFDLGMEHDGTALAIGHLEFNDQIGIELVYDYIDRMIIGEAFSGPGVENIIIPGEKGKYDDPGYTALPLIDILLWMKAMHDVLPCFKGVTDQHGGAMLEQLLQINGITGMELVHLTPAINSEMYYALKGYIDNKRCRFPNVPKFTHEIKQVEAVVVSKYQLRVKAKEEKGSHDDMCDAVALVAWQAMNYLQGEGRLLLDPTGLSFAMQERRSRPPAVIADISNVSMRDLKMIERESQIRQNTPLPGYDIVKNPFHKRGR